MNTKRVARALAPALVAAGALHGKTLYERDGVTLEGSVRMVHLNAATCQVLEENESPEAYEQMKANHGRPLHVWRVDYSALNGSGQSLSDLTAHVQIDAEWPPCTNWTGLGQYPGPVQWAGSFETIQRTGGLEAGGEARETLYVLAIDGQEPGFRNWQLDFRFGETTVPSEPEPGPAAIEPPRPRVPQPICNFEDIKNWGNCWYKLANPADCYAWFDGGDWPGDPEWTGECIDGLASGPGMLIANGWDPYTEEDRKRESTGTFRAGKKHGQWVEVRVDGWVEEGPYVDGRRHGRWTSFGVDREYPSGHHYRIYTQGDYGPPRDLPGSR